MAEAHSPKSIAPETELSLGHRPSPRCSTASHWKPPVTQSRAIRNFQVSSRAKKFAAEV